jgi:hypothetical protein
MLRIPSFYKGRYRDQFMIRGDVYATLFDEYGNVKMEQHQTNAFSAAGLNCIVDQLTASPGTNKPTHMSVGSGTAAAGALQTHVDTNALTSKTDALGVLTMVGDWAAGDATATLTEVAIRDAAAGNYLSAVALTSVPKAAGDTLAVTYTWTAA